MPRARTRPGGGRLAAPLLARALTLLFVAAWTACPPPGEAVIVAPLDGELLVSVGTAAPIRVARRSVGRMRLPRGAHELVIRGPKDPAARTVRVSIDRLAVLVPASAEQCLVRLDSAESQIGRTAGAKLLPQIEERYRLLQPIELPASVSPDALVAIPCSARSLHALELLTLLGYDAPQKEALTFCGRTIGRARTEVECSDPSLRDLAPLAQLKAIRKLTLEGTAAEDLTPLRGLAHLEELSLEDTRAADLTPLGGLARLRSLTLNGCPVRSLAPLARVTSLRRLDLRETKVDDLRPLGALASLEFLDLSHTAVDDLAPLGTSQGLERLFLGHTRVHEVSPLAKLIKLRELDLRHTAVQHLGGLRELVRLEELLLSDTKVSDLSPLRRLTRLQTLYLAGTRVRDLGPLARLNELGVLYLAGTPVRDLAPLRRLRQLRSLGISRTAVTDLGPLLQHEGLGTLAIVGLRIAPAQLRSLKKRNPELELIVTQAQLDRENTPR